MPVLLCAQDIPGAADLEVAHGDLDSGAKLRELPDGLQPLFRLLFEELITLIHEKSKRGAVGTPDTPADLIQLGKAKTVCIVDYHGIRIGNVKPCLDDCR